MAVFHADVLVLRTRKFSETSLIASLLSREHGRVDVLAKGARREKSPMFGHLDLYQREDVLVMERPQAGLDLLIETAFIDEFAGLRFFPFAFAAAGVLSELALYACPPAEPQPRVFDAMIQAFATLSDLGEPRVKARLRQASGFNRMEKAILAGRVFKLSLLDMLRGLGFGLELDRCVACGMPVAADKRYGINKRLGGLVCGSCRTGQATPIGHAALAALAESGDGSGQAELSLSPGERRNWLRFLVDYTQYVLEKPLKGKKVLFQLMP